MMYFKMYSHPSLDQSTVTFIIKADIIGWWCAAELLKNLRYELKAYFYKDQHAGEVLQATYRDHLK